MLGCAHEYVRQKVRQNGQNLQYLIYNILVINDIKITTELNVKEKQVLIHQHIYEAHKGNLSYTPNNLFSQAYLSLKDVEM